LAPLVRLALLFRAAVVSLLLFGVAVALPVGSDAADPGTLRDKVGQAKDREQSLESSVARLAASERKLSRQIAALEQRRTSIQADLDRDEAQLERVQADLRAERARALRLRQRLDQARTVLRTRLVERYKASDVDALSVVLNATSFANLMERAAFLRRIQDNDEEIVVTVRHARRDALDERRRLDAAEERQSRIVAGLRARRNALARMAAGVASRRTALGRIKAAREAALSTARRDRRKAESDLRSAEAAAARAARAAAASPPPSVDIPKGGWAIPWEVVECESGGQNLPPNSAGASGYYQIMPATWKGLGGKGPHAYLRPKAEQDAAAAKLWAGGAGAHNWVCYDLVN
jgi:peptidoglycan hydrolase CwlO-like protein